LAGSGASKAQRDDTLSGGILPAKKNYQKDAELSPILGDSLIDQAATVAG
jgi:hypothetical protein